MHRIKLRTKPLLLFFILFAVASVSAHEIKLKNGDRITGNVVSGSPDSVIIDTPYAGKITIALDYIETIDNAPASAKLATIIPEAKAKPDPEAVTSAKPDDNAEPKPEEKQKPELKKKDAAAEPQKPADELKPVPKLFGDGRFFGLIDGWQGDANIGFSYTSGNSETSTLATGIKATKTGGSDKMIVYLRSLWNANRLSNQRITQNAVWGGFRYDRDFNDRMFTFGSWDFERDRPKNLNFRSVIGAGVGHHTIKGDHTELDLLAGLAWNRAWQIGENTNTPEFLTASSLKHRFNDRFRIQQTFTFYQDVTNGTKYRFIYDTSFTADITKRIGWHITVGDRFNNLPIGDAKKNDLLLTTGIKWNFGRKKK
jgi:putative salt-induced outer membrane protein YdiY